ncbi:DedA family protein [Pseudalkalibacillus caeni]|uniref:DedA family protein n=1 Tax=Exobacillus caeni TaxID=2574798 RepID=A0A5R9F8E2_9BACL|nr:DedA family protein [Pseudalkalibacillus caeni]TLS37113.1 DedA family protein [Pseudalkalibacillus caeni]
MHNLIIDLLKWLTDLGYFGIALGLMVEVIPSEIVLSYGGYMVSQGTITFVGAVIAGTIGGTIAQLFLYWLGYYGGRPFLDKYGKYLLIKKHHIDMSETWFTKYGTGVIFTARFIPVVRHAISIPAGIARMSFAKFTMYTALAIIPWSIFFLYLGVQLGDNWENISSIAGPYTKPIGIIAIMMILLYILYKRANRKNNRTV